MYRVSIMKFSYLFMSIFFWLCFTGIAQEKKVESEQRVEQEFVPQESIEWLNEVFRRPKQLKWYKETTSGITSYEAKFKQDGKKFSVEFSESGAFEDIEFIVRWKSLDNELRETLLQGMSGFEKIKVKKVQEQWTSNQASQLAAGIEEGRALQGITQKYELVIQAEKEGETSLWEVLITESGEVERVQEVVLRSTANLDF